MLTITSALPAMLWGESVGAALQGLPPASRSQLNPALFNSKVKLRQQYVPV